MSVVSRRGVALAASDLKGPLINPASSFRSHQGFASFPLIVAPSDSSTTWVMRPWAWNIQPTESESDVPGGPHEEWPSQGGVFGLGRGPGSLK